MLQQIISSFVGSSEAGGLVQSLAAQGLSPEKAQAAVVATAEGAQQAVGDAGVGGLLALASDGDGPLGMLGGLLGGSAGASAGMSGPMVDQIASFVASKVGIDPAMAKKVVGMVLPKIIDLAKDKGGGGLLGGLLG